MKEYNEKGGNNFGLLGAKQKRYDSMMNTPSKLFFLTLVVLAITGISIKIYPYFREGKVLGESSINLAANPGFESVSQNEIENAMDVLKQQTHSKMESVQESKRAIELMVLESENRLRNIGLEMSENHNQENAMSGLMAQMNSNLEKSKGLLNEMDAIMTEIFRLKEKISEYSIAQSDLSKTDPIFNQVQLYVTEMDLSIRDFDEITSSIKKLISNEGENRA